VTGSAGAVKGADPKAGAGGEAPGAGALDEIQQVERARAAIRRRDAGAAFGALGDYERSFPRGKFASEIPLLRIEALAIQNPAAARQLARDYLERNPNSPLATRLRNAVGLQEEAP
jgi:hypothetical protein